MTDKDYLEKTIAFDHQTWIAAHPEAISGDLLKYLQSVREEMFRFNDDDLIADVLDEFTEEAQAYLLGWGDPDEPVYKDQLPTIEYRSENINEDIGRVEEFVELLGAEFLLSDLPDLPPSLRIAG